MTADEVRIRSAYLFLACSQGVERLKDRLAATVPAATAVSARMVFERALRRELGLLFRYWTTRQIWARLESQEEDAKRMNLALLRLFTEAFKLPRDGSGLRYAECSGLAEEVHELSHRVINALGMTPQALLTELQSAILPWRDTVMKYTSDALELSLDQLALSVNEWTERSPGSSR